MLFDYGVTHLFIYYSCVKLKLSVSSLNNDLVVETPTNGSMLTLYVYLNCLVLPTKL